jgi:hypothetical protein
VDGGGWQKSGIAQRRLLILAAGSRYMMLRLVLWWFMPAALHGTNGGNQTELAAGIL